MSRVSGNGWTEKSTAYCVKECGEKVAYMLKVLYYFEDELVWDHPIVGPTPAIGDNLVIGGKFYRVNSRVWYPESGTISIGLGYGVALH